MSYEVELSPEARQNLSALEEPLSTHVIEHRLRLADAPTTFSTPAPTPPNVPGFQLYEFTVVRSNQIHHFRVLFKYGEDERTLHVYIIGHVAGPLDEP